MTGERRGFGLWTKRTSSKLYNFRGKFRGNNELLLNCKQRTAFVIIAFVIVCNSVIVRNRMVSNVSVICIVSVCVLRYFKGRSGAV